MVGKKSGKALKREEGLERTDNNMSFTSWPVIQGINQKNYYTEYLKRDDQILPLRLTQEERRNRLATQHKDKDRARALNEANGDMDVSMDIDEEGGLDDMAGGSGDQDFLSGNNVIVIHPGSQNLRIGFANDALPKSVPMVIARKWRCNESEEGGGEPAPKRIKLSDEAEIAPRQLFGEEFANIYDNMCQTLKVRMRQNKRKVLPNSKELVVNYNDRIEPEQIPEHNDLQRVEWTEIPRNPKDAPNYFTGAAALRIPENSNPRYKLFWPLRRGWYNEDDYDNKFRLFEDITTIIEEAIKTQLKIKKSQDLEQCSCIFVVPDLYERNYVTQTMEMLLRDVGFGRICFIQESLAATFGCGHMYPCCVVDIGAQKTSICCVEDGQCMPESRINLKLGGADITETFIKMMLFDHFPYTDVNLNRRYDFLLAEELKAKYCTMKEDNISVQLYDFHVRAPNQPTRKYMFKTYDEVLLAVLGLFRPEIFDNSRKLRGRRKLIPPSYDQFEDIRNDPTSLAQSRIVSRLAPETFETSAPANANGIINGAKQASILKRNLPAGHAFNLAKESHGTPSRDTPTVDADGTPLPGTGTDGATTEVLEPCLRDDVLPVIDLETAVLTSLDIATGGDEKRFKEFTRSILFLGGVAKTPDLSNYLESRLNYLRPNFNILITQPPREMDHAQVVWKGASVLAKLRSVADLWIGKLEFERLGTRTLHHKCMWAW